MKNQKVNTKVNIEMGYMLIETINDQYSDINMPIINKAHKNDEYKKSMNGLIRANFSTEFNTKNKTLGDLLNDATSLLQSKELKQLTSITQKLQQYIVDNSELVLPDLKLINDQIMVTDFTSKLIFDKSKLTYRTNIYRRFTIDLVEAELKMLDFLQEYVDNKLDKYIDMHFIFICWRYLIDGKDVYTLQDFINHRRENLKLENNTHLIK